MTDIVERLRARQVTNWVHATGQTPRASGKRTDPLCAAAADEIERLRAEVAGLREELEAARQVMRSVRVFVTSREKIKHPEGTEWFDSAVTAIDAALAARKGEA